MAIFQHRNRRVVEEQLLNGRFRSKQFQQQLFEIKLESLIRLKAYSWLLLFPRVKRSELFIPSSYG